MDDLLSDICISLATLRNSSPYSGTRVEACLFDRFVRFVNKCSHFRALRLRSVESWVRIKNIMGYVSIPGGGGTPLYGLYRYVPRNRVWFLEVLDP